jgi:D-glycero-beta-D-manno-heptose-7-phosphate kinase
MDIRPEDINKWFSAFNDLTIMVIGDVMIDSYLWGKVQRISPEAPVPVVEVFKEENRMGGAANVALNLMELGATPVICSVIGQDEKESTFRALMAKRGFTDEGIISSPQRVTTVKTRVISSGQHLLRVDQEKIQALQAEEETELIARCKSIMASQKIDAIIFEDYDKGVLTPNVIQAIVEEANSKGIVTAVDPKKDHFFDYRKVTLFKPNLKELREGMKLDFEGSDLVQLEKAVVALEQELGNYISFVTLSENGVWIKQGEAKTHIAAHSREIMDVSGAGDTVISVATLGLAIGLQPEHLAALANLAGGLVCERVGVVPIQSEQLRKEALKLLVA